MSWISTSDKAARGHGGSVGSQAGVKRASSKPSHNEISTYRYEKTTVEAVSLFASTLVEATTTPRLSGW